MERQIQEGDVWETSREEDACERFEGVRGQIGGILKEKIRRILM